MSSKRGGVSTDSYVCLDVHVIGHNSKECIDRLDTLVQLLKAGSMDYPDYTEVTWNHGGGGGP